MIYNATLYDGSFLVTKTIGASMTTYTYPATSNKLTGIVRGATTAVATDLNGSITNDGSNQYAYDLRGKLAQTTTTLGKVNYEVNAQGLRVRKQAAYSGGTDTMFFYDQQGHLIGEVPTGGPAFGKEYVYLGDVPLAVMDGGSGLNFIHTDYLGTPRAITNPAAQMVWKWENLDPYGDNVPTENPSGLGVYHFDIGFPGQYRDRETSIVYNINRYLNSATGRYNESDLIGLAGGINTFGYVGGNPLSNVDPLGLYTEIAIWNGVGKGESQFGHVSTNVNGQNWSWGSGGWDTQYPSASAYVARQQSFRGGTGYVLDLTPLEEAKVAACLQAHSGNYNFIKNNCTTPPQECLPPRFNTGGSLTPRGLGQDLRKSPGLIGTKTYQGPERTGSPFDSPALWGF